MLEIPELHWLGIEEGVRRLTGGYVRIDFLCETIKTIINYFPRWPQILFTESIKSELVTEEYTNITENNSSNVLCWPALTLEMLL